MELETGNFTQDRLAEIAGLHRVTVTRALRGDKSVSPATRQRVRELAAELGYRPNAAARSLRSRRSRQIGVLIQANPVDRLRHPVAFETLLGISEGLEEAGYAATLIRFQAAVREPGALSRALQEHLLDGIIVAALDAPFHDRFRERFGACVWVEARRDEHLCLWRDEAGAGRLAVEQLAAAGHRQAWYLDSAMRLSGIHWAVQRLAGAQAAAASAGLDLTVVPERPHRVAGEPYRLDLDLRPGDAVVPSSGYAAQALLPLLADGGLAPGRDVSIACPDDGRQIALTWPALSRASFDRFEMGRLAAAMAIDHVERPRGPHRSRVLGTDWIKGSTIASPSLD